MTHVRQKGAVICALVGLTLWWPTNAYADDAALSLPRPDVAAPSITIETFAKPLTLDDCVRIATTSSAQVEEAQAKVREFEARLDEVQSIYYPKITGMAYAAPMYSVRGNGYADNFEIHWKSVNDWGPFTYLEALFALPLYTFGRAEAGAEAMKQRAQVEQARVREATNVVALETKRMYYLRLFALSMQPALGNARKLLDDARTRAQTLYDSGSGDVTQVDLAKLTYGATEIARHQRASDDGAKLALAALKHTMGVPETVPVELMERILPAVDDDPNALFLPALLEEAASARPEWAQLEHGKQATLAWEHAEKLANWPALFVAGQIRAAWAPTRDRDNNPWHYDIYNTLTGGAVVGLKFDLDPALASAKAELAAASGAQVDALRRFAATGIPLQVRKAFDDVQRAHSIIETSNEGVMATRRWMTFAAAAYASGTGEARDVLEGLVSYLQSKRTYLENLQGYYTARAELAYAVGRQ